MPEHYAEFDSKMNQNMTFFHDPPLSYVFIRVKVDCYGVDFDTKMN